MNERIKELAAKAGIYGAVDINGNYDNEEEVKKFAELIVRECINQCADNGSNDEWDKGVRWAVAQIKQHFGVEE